MAEFEAGEHPKLSPPWQITLAAVLAFAAYGYRLYLRQQEIVLPLGCILAVTASHFSAARLERRSWASWLLRLAVFGIAIGAAISQPAQETYGSELDEHLITAGQLCMLELTLQFWQWPPIGGRPGVTAVFLSGIVFTVSAHIISADGAYSPVQAFAPAYIAALILGLRALRQQALGRDTGFRAYPWKSWGALAAALLLGCLLSTLMTVYRYELDRSVLAGLVPNMLQNANAGLSDAPRLGSSPNMEFSRRRVLAVRGHLKTPHLRAQSFDTYEKGAWLPAAGSRRFEPVPLPQLRPDAAGEQIEITRLTGDFNTLCVPLHAAGLQLRRRALEWSPGDGGPLRTALWTAPPFNYGVILASDSCHQGPFCSAPSLAQRLRCLKVPPEIGARVRSLAADITANLAPAQQAEAVEKHLMANHAYSLQASPGRGDPLADFLLNKRSAHCEYFASSAVMLLRCAGVPARYVTGFFVHESRGGEMIVRQRDSHAWAEAWIDGTGWITVEATPGGGRPGQYLTRLSFWGRWMEHLRDALSDVRDFLAASGPAGWGALSALGAGLLALIRWWRKRRRRTAQAVKKEAYSDPNAALIEIARQFTGLLRRQNAHCPPCRTWAEYLEELRQSSSAGAREKWRAAAGFAAFYNRVRFRTPDDALAIRELQERLRQLKLKK